MECRIQSVSRLQRTENICHILVMQLCRRIVGPGSACDVFVSDYHVDNPESCVEFSRPYRVLRIKTLTQSQLKRALSLKTGQQILFLQLKLT